MTSGNKLVAVVALGGMLSVICLTALGHLSAANTEANIVEAIKAGASPLEASCAIDTVHSDVCRILIAKKSAN